MRLSVAASAVAMATLHALPLASSFQPRVSTYFSARKLYSSTLDTTETKVGVESDSSNAAAVSDDSKKSITQRIMEKTSSSGQ